MDIKHAEAKAKYYGLIAAGKTVEWRTKGPFSFSPWFTHEPLWLDIPDITYEIREAHKLYTIQPFSGEYVLSLTGDEVVLRFETRASAETFFKIMLRRKEQI